MLPSFFNKPIDSQSIDSQSIDSHSMNKSVLSAIKMHLSLAIVEGQDAI